MLSLFKYIDTFVCDVDGVLTDSSLILVNDGQMARKVNIKDGYALQLAVKKGYKIIILSGGTSEAVLQRFSKLGITDIFLNVDNKVDKLTAFVNANKLTWDKMLFMGDDIPDYASMQLVGLPACPLDAVPEIKQISKYISPLTGGNGCVRDVIEKVLKLNGHWDLNNSIASK
ncbi:MAG: 3-deoxy-D-manno-octulosonate 8-phosphate phosphatase [Chitinophagaceae bacterium]|nr:3-deoxy-D-manno-octulosonate 8-phosphate phosphatase [Chitinophagaceae bacterium]